MANVRHVPRVDAARFSQQARRFGLRCEQPARRHHRPSAGRILLVHFDGRAQPSAGAFERRPRGEVSERRVWLRARMRVVRVQLSGQNLHRHLQRRRHANTATMERRWRPVASLEPAADYHVSAMLTYWMFFALLFPIILSFCPHQLDLGYKGYYNGKTDECITYVNLDDQGLNDVSDGYEEAKILCGQFYNGHLAHMTMGHVTIGNVPNNTKNWDAFYLDLPYEKFWDERNGVYLDGWKINGIKLTDNATRQEDECVATLTIYDDRSKSEFESTESCNEFFPVRGKSGIFFDCNNTHLYSRTNPGCAVFAYGNLNSYTYLTLIPCKSRAWTGFFCSSKRMKNCQKKAPSSTYETGSTFCTCLPGFAGEYCEIEVKSDEQLDCGPWGVRINLNGRQACGCFQDAYGNRCESQYYDYEEYQDYKIEWNFICYATFPIIILHIVLLIVISCCQWNGFISILQAYPKKPNSK
ncbi:hypothetical protein T08_12892 [Trichinella sp. T8]|nr:hypothetical protein T08_12892 [Trichinella sp. T8]